MTASAGTGAIWGVAAVAVSLVLPLPLPAAAQPAQPVPVQRKLDRLFERERSVITRDPLADQKRALRRQFEDPARRAGLPPQPKFDAPPSGPQAAPAPEPSLTPDLSRMDRNRDGAISRDEYMRLDSRFRGADVNRDGRVTPQELDAYGNPRF
jgi:hypothetical protein